LESGRGRKNGGCVAITPSGYAIKNGTFIKRHLELMTNATLPAWSLAEAEKTVDVSRLRRLVTQ
ncbi:hypothetical protein C2U36_27110, partial [Escherichia coli]